MTTHVKQIILPYGAWQKEEAKTFVFPQEWNIKVMNPEDAPEISDNDLEKSFSHPIGTSEIKKIFDGKKNAVIVIDDITRPAPLGRILKKLISIILDTGMSSNKITILIATGAHRPMSSEEIEQKVSIEISQKYRIIMHDFMGEDNQKVGWIDGGPVYINKHFINADLKICLGGVLPHGETGFGGASKLVVPGIAGNLSIAHLHGALPARPVGQIEPLKEKFDRRSWIESVTQKLGVDLAVCVLVNSKRQIAGVVVGDIIEAHRKAAKLAGKIGKTTLKKESLQDLDILIVNTYPLDTDPIQMGKSLNATQKLSPKAIVIINSASDGIFYHGMGMGSGISIKRLFHNVPGFIGSFCKIKTWARSMITALKHPLLAIRLSYFTLNNLSYKDYDRYKKDIIAKYIAFNRSTPDLYVYSENFPDWGFYRRYPKGKLFHDWNNLIQALEKKIDDKPNVLIFPCSPLQVIELKNE